MKKIVSMLVFVALMLSLSGYAFAQVSIGTVINLQNQYPNVGGYLDTRGRIQDKAEFSMVNDANSYLFVSTHPDRNRDSGSGNWKIISADGKSEGADLRYGDNIHLQNMYPNGGYLDTRAYSKDLPAFSNYTAAFISVFTSPSATRDGGSGTWTVLPTENSYAGTGDLVMANDVILLQNAWNNNGGGNLDTIGYVTQNPAFADYSGSALLVFTANSTNRDNGSTHWRITPASVTVDLEAGPIWNNDDAATKCSELASANGGSWTGGWLTTVENQMSVCNITLAKPVTVSLEVGPLWNQGDADEKCLLAAVGEGGYWNGNWLTTVQNAMSVCSIDFY